MNDNRNEKAAAVILLLDGHSRLYPNALAGISDTDAVNRIGTAANHMAWIAGSMLYERYFLLRAIGGHTAYTADPLFEDHKGLQENAVYPSPEKCIKDWNQITPVLRSAIMALTDEAWSGADPFGMPGGPYTLADAMLYCIDRESYCLGQLGLYRRLLGYPAMSYE